ncbi:MAG TPA: hypothetical protein VGN82_25485 [Bosea sp. (in: a-proteobacteria)]|uniref:hypothetical protein n=1 Tax=Bosea sp. (in: a-proteobacteria) TaxID=1871050 RepID=UPI002E102B51|nr:hypothetical protein [Bosea sp. (in: a-proteobacteria)]
MSRTGTIRLGLLLAALLMPIGVAEAAGPGSGFFASAPRAVNVASRGVHHLPGIRQRLSPGVQHRLSRGPWIRNDGARVHDERFGRRHDRGRFTSFGYVGPWAYPGYFGPWPYPAGQGSAYAAPSDDDGPQRSIDPNSFEFMPASTGIARAPTPQPTIYRLEGRRDRPATRVIRIGDPEPRQIRRSRFAHAETGALLLIVPGR